MMADISSGSSTNTSYTLEFAKVAAALAWPLLVAGALVVLRHPVMSLVRALTLRVSEGAGFKTPWLEIGTVKISREQGIKPPNGIRVENDAGEKLKASLAEFDEDSRLIFLAHQLFRPTVDGNVYDILIYLVPLSQNNWLRNVESVGYYFGFNDSKDVFVSRNFGSKFAVAISAFEPLTCSARVRFNDGDEVLVHRFIDFEMAPELALVPVETVAKM